MIAHTFDYDTLAIPNGWDCFQFKGWLYRRGASGEKFYREKWIGEPK